MTYDQSPTSIRITTTVTSVTTTKDTMIKNTVCSNCNDDVTARTDPLLDDSSIESIDTWDQEPKGPIAFVTHSTVWVQTIATHKIQESAHADTMFNT